jgi:ABC-type polysaccharide transport system permease subunit
MGMNKNKTYPIYFVSGALILYAVLYVLPSLIGIGYAFTDWSAYSDKLKFVGLDNYKLVFSSNEDYLSIITNTLKFTSSLFEGASKQKEALMIMSQCIKEINENCKAVARDRGRPKGEIYKTASEMNFTTEE